MSLWDDLFGTTTTDMTRTGTTGSNIPGIDATAQNAIDEAGRLYNLGPADYYQGQLIAPRSEDTLAAQDMIRQQALAGFTQPGAEASPLMDAAQGEMMRTIQGDYLGGNNPYLDQALTSAFDKARSGIDAQFAGSGRYGSGLHRIGLGETFGNIGASTMAKEYEAERNRQVAAQGFAPQMAQANMLRDVTANAQAQALHNQGYADAGALGGIGSAQNQVAQDMINTDLARWNYEKNAPQDMLTNYMNALSGGSNIAGTTTTVTPPPTYTNNTANTLGGALSGAQAGAQIGSLFGDYGGYGAIAGGLLGAFS